ncbi:hypothetical protein M885DRAFT_3443 [Pelagophyceae sp. CCMP2097]|nr:hypothetical protein M885DRAFT_3443 [Pelagophyceae sp. CCMP2097]
MDEGIMDEAAAADDGAPLTFEVEADGASRRLPAEIARAMFPHQKDGVAWLLRRYFEEDGSRGGIVGDAPGVGKTLTRRSSVAGSALRPSADPLFSAPPRPRWKTASHHAVRRFRQSSPKPVCKVIMRAVARRCAACPRRRWLALRRRGDCATGR